jgi:RimJ/RimL family protein N-acetyltransferase
MDPIFTCECIEPEGKVIRNVYPLVLTKENLDKLWKKFRKFKTIFSQEINNDFNTFVNLFVSQNGDNWSGNGLLWIIDDFVGVYYITDFEQQGDKFVDAKAHYAFFDCRHKGRQELTKKMLDYLFNTYKFHRLTIELPMYAKDFPKFFVESLGFKREGRKRSAIEYNGQWYDVRLYGMLDPKFDDPIHRVADEIADKYNNYSYTDTASLKSDEVKYTEK